MISKTCVTVVLFTLAIVQLFATGSAENSAERNLNSIDSENHSDKISNAFGYCDEKDNSISCQSIRIARNVMNQLIKAKKSNTVGDVKIVDGVELVRSQNLGDGGRGLNDGSMLGKVAGFLQSHELRVKLPDLFGKEQLNGVFSETMRSFDEHSDLVETGRKKGKGDGGVLLMGLMMAKTLAAIGFGGIGLLTMKALMVSLMALMLSAIIGVKKLASGGSDDHGGHQVHYVQAHSDHHRKRRSAEEENLAGQPLPYRAWTQYASRVN